MKRSDTFSLACRNTALGAIRLYRAVLSPDHGIAGLIIKRVLPYGFISSGCRFSPSCSAYAQQAIRQYGLRRGVMVSCARILRCHPGSAGGYDPVNKPQCPNPNFQ